jgi:hypothetical protein
VVVVIRENSMITKYNFYDGIPVGVREFQEYFDTIKKSANAALMFAFFESNEEVINSTVGGYLENAPVVLKALPTGIAGSSAYVLSGVNGSIGTLFLKGSAYFDTYEVPLVDGVDDVRVATWELLGTDGEYKIDGNLHFTLADNPLPLHVIRKVEGGAVMERGLYDIRYNGIPQMNDASSFYDNDGRLADIRFSKLILGAEYPYPVLASKYVYTSRHQSLSFFRSKFASNARLGYFDLMFPHSNFVVEGAIIILRRVVGNGNILYLNVLEDTTPGPVIKPNRFKLVDKARGIVRFNLTDDFITNLKINALEPDAAVSFEIICPEILMEEISNNVVYYRSRYGGISYSASENAEILRYVDTGSRLEPIATQKLSTSNNDVILSEKKTRTPSTILAVKYYADPIIDPKKQTNKYIPDTFMLFFTNGIITPNPDGVLGSLDINKTSWYNWDANISEYKPVNRLERANIGLIDTIDIPYTKGIIFNPRQEVKKEKVGLSEWTYVHDSKRTIGTKNEFVRRDAAIPEPHHVNPVMTKMILPADELLRVPQNEQMHIALSYTVDGILTVDGYLIVT